MQSTAKKEYRLFVVLALVSLCCYGVIAYGIPRTSFIPLLLLTALLFSGYWGLIKKDFSGGNFKQLMILVIVSRLVFLFAIPSLSDDYFRFIWDGVLTNSGINPYLYVPASVNIGVPVTFENELKAGMNSLPYFSPYPPVLQACFFVGVKLGGYHLLSDIVALRILSLLAETGVILLLLKMLAHLQLPRHLVFLYALNPLVIMELTGNLHGEVWMILFLLGSVYMLLKQHYAVSALLLGLAISSKLLPLMFMPVIISYIGIRRGWMFCLISILTFAVSFVPFMDGVFIQHMAQSVGYYFQKFEFNASIYYVLRWIGYDITGFNLIYFIGSLLPVVALAFILWIAFHKKVTTVTELFERLLYTLLIYYLFSLIVHPWYITVLVAVTVFTKQRFALGWSALVMLSYSTYIQQPYHEMLWLTAIEYTVLGVIVLLEYRGRKRNSKIES